MGIPFLSYRVYSESDEFFALAIQRLTSYTVEGLRCVSTPDHSTKLAATVLALDPKCLW